MKILLSKSTIPKLFAKQIGWQSAFIRLFICHANSTNMSKWVTNTTESNAGDQIVSLANKKLSGTNEDEVIWPLPDDLLVDVNNERCISFYLANEEPPSPLALSPPKFSMISNMSNFNDPYSSGPVRQLRSSSIASHDSSDGLGDSGAPPRGFTLNSRLSIQSDASSLLTSSLTSSEWTQSKEEEAMATALRNLGITRNEHMEKAEELCQNLLIVIYTIMWKGIDSSDDAAWQV